MWAKGCNRHRALFTSRRIFVDPRLATGHQVRHSGSATELGRAVGRLRASILLIALAMTVLACGSASAQTVDLQLVLAVDTSGSVSEARFELQ